MYQPCPCRVNRDRAGGRWPRSSGSRLIEGCLLEERHLTAVRERKRVEAKKFADGRGAGPRYNQSEIVQHRAEQLFHTLVPFGAKTGALGNGGNGVVVPVVAPTGNFAVQIGKLYLQVFE